MEKFRCENCGKEILESKRFCSKECKKNWNNSVKKELSEYREAQRHMKVVSKIYSFENTKISM